MAINGMVAEATDDGLVPVVLNLALGILVLLVALPIAHAIAGAGYLAPPPPWEQPLLWLGGPLGVGFLLLSAIVIRPLGVCWFISLVAIGGRLRRAPSRSTSWSPTSAREIGWRSCSASGLTGAAVLGRRAAVSSVRAAPRASVGHGYVAWLTNRRAVAPRARPSLTSRVRRGARTPSTCGGRRRARLRLAPAEDVEATPLDPALGR
jgi:uncharacterized membrane protein YdcZ (DUF606 family)